MATTLRQDIIARSREQIIEYGGGSRARLSAYRAGQRDGESYLAGGKNTFDGQGLMERMKNGAYKGGFHQTMRNAGGGY